MVGFWLLGGVAMRAAGFLLVLTVAGAPATTGNTDAVLANLAGAAL